MSACPACKFENPAGRRFCQKCGTVLAAIPNGRIVQTQLKTDEPATLSVELQQARQQLEQARQEESRLAQLLDARENELKTAREEIARVASASPAVTRDHAAIDGLQQQLAAVSSDKQQLQQQLEAALLQATNSNGGSTAKTSPLKRVGLAVGSLILASATGLGGFKYGQVDPDKTHVAKTQALTTQLSSAQSQVQDLQTQLNSARQNVDQLTTQLSTREHETQDATGKLSRAQRDLAVVQASLTEKTSSERQLRQEQQTARQNISQLTQELSNRASQIQSLQQTLQRHPAWSMYANYNGPLSGTITWEGERTKDKDKPFNITFERGQFTTDGSTKTNSMSGDLPRVPVVVQSIDKGVYIAVAPNAKSGWGRMMLHIEGKNHIVARISWSVL